MTRRRTTIPRIFAYKGETASLAEHVRRLGLDAGACYRRISRMGGFDPARLDAVFAPCVHIERFAYKGVVDTLAGHARRLGLRAAGCEARRRKYGLSPETLDRIFTPPEKGVVYRGIRDTLAGHARRYGLKPSLVQSRHVNLGSDPSMLPRIFGHDPRYQPKLFTVDGIRATAREHAARLGIGYSTFRHRKAFWGVSERTLPHLLAPMRTTRLYTYGGITDTIPGWARRLGVSEEGIRGRIKAFGLSEDALPKVFSPVRIVSCRPRSITYGGITDSVAGWARRLMISPAALWQRLTKMSIAEALTKPPTPDYRKSTKRLTFRGETKTVIEWAKATGIHGETIHYRLRHGWTVEEALTVPRGGLRKETGASEATANAVKHGRLAAIDIIV